MTTDVDDQPGGSAPDPAGIDDAAALAAALAVLKGARSYNDLTVAAGDLTPASSRVASTVEDWTPEPLSRGTVSDWISGRGKPTRAKLLTYLTVCGVPGTQTREWLAALDRVRPNPNPAPRRTPAASITRSAAGAKRWRPVALGAGGAAAAIAAILTIGFASTGTAAGGHDTPPSATASPAPGPGEVPAPPPVGEGTVIEAVYDHPGGCSSSVTVSVDPHGDRRLDGATALWVAGVLDAPPNIMYYPKVRVPLPLTSPITIPPLPMSTEQGTTRKGRFSLLLARTPAGDADLTASKASDDAHDDLYDDSRRTQLQLGTIALAVTPIVEQVC